MQYVGYRDIKIIMVDSLFDGKNLLCSEVISFNETFRLVYPLNLSRQSLLDAVEFWILWRQLGVGYPTISYVFGSG